jgi:hypothetical protein
MLTITDAASETMIRLDMTNPFLWLVTKLSLGARSAGSAHRCSNLRLKVQRDSAYDRDFRVRGPAPADGLNVHRALKILRRRGESALATHAIAASGRSLPAAVLESRRGRRSTAGTPYFKSDGTIHLGGSWSSAIGDRRSISASQAVIRPAILDADEGSNLGSDSLLMQSGGCLAL